MGAQDALVETPMRRYQSNANVLAAAKDGPFMSDRQSFVTSRHADSGVKLHNQSTQLGGRSMNHAQS